MTNLRQYKKYVATVVSDIVAECAFAIDFYQDVDTQVLARAIAEALALQSDTLQKLGAHYDRTPRSFANGAEYRRARRAWTRQAFANITRHFDDGVQQIVALMNSALPKKG